MLSYARGETVPSLDVTLYRAFTAAAARRPDHVALISMYQGHRLTYRELDALIHRTACGLVSLGLRANDRIGVWAPNSLEWLLVQFACARIGAVFVNVNPAYRAFDLAYVLRKSGMRAIFFIEKDARADYRAILSDARNGQDLPLEHAIAFGTPEWERLLQQGGRFDGPEPQPDDVLSIMYTSGTTGSPKGVLLTNFGLMNATFHAGDNYGVTEADRPCLTLPLFHLAGFFVTVMAFARGATLILPSAQFDPAALLKAIHEERASVILAVPTMWVAMLEHPACATTDFSSLRLASGGGAPCAVELMQRVVDRTGASMSIVYGQTEAATLVTMGRVGDPPDRCVSTVGRVAQNTELKIVSPATGETVPEGEQGELLIRNPMIMRGYDQEPEATARTIDSDGWLHSGDLATMDPGGWFHITGRVKEMIIRGGENLFPAEIEAFLCTHPAVAEAYVIGLPDAKLGEAVLAWIRLAAGSACSEGDIRAYCQGKIAHFKIPQYIRFVDSFPLTASGKVQKFAIRQQEIEERELQAVAQARTA
jgi:fatty-acyl-CoA synthase